MISLLQIRVIPVLMPEDVARETINAILTNEPICIVPGYMKFLMMLKS